MQLQLVIVQSTNTTEYTWKLSFEAFHKGATDCVTALSKFWASSNLLNGADILLCRTRPESDEQ